MAQYIEYPTSRRDFLRLIAGTGALLFGSCLRSQEQPLPTPPQNYATPSPITTPSQSYQTPPPIPQPPQNQPLTLEQIREIKIGEYNARGRQWEQDSSAIARPVTPISGRATIDDLIDSIGRHIWGLVPQPLQQNFTVGWERTPQVNRETILQIYRFPYEHYSKGYDDTGRKRFNFFNAAYANALRVNPENPSNEIFITGDDSLIAEYQNHYPWIGVRYQSSQTGKAFCGLDMLSIPDQIIVVNWEEFNRGATQEGKTSRFNYANMERLIEMK